MLAEEPLILEGVGQLNAGRTRSSAASELAGLLPGGMLQFPNALRYMCGPRWPRMAVVVEALPPQHRSGTTIISRVS
jgi:hypothetical protein